jgi:hypothetical protein
VQHGMSVGTKSLKAELVLSRLARFEETDLVPCDHPLSWLVRSDKSVPSRLIEPFDFALRFSSIRRVLSGQTPLRLNAT